MEDQMPRSVSLPFARHPMDDRACRSRHFLMVSQDGSVPAGSADLVEGASTRTTGTYDSGAEKRTSVAKVQKLVGVTFDGSLALRLRSAGSEESGPSAVYITRTETDLGCKPAVDLTRGIQRKTRWFDAHSNATLADS